MMTTCPVKSLSWMPHPLLRFLFLVELINFCLCSTLSHSYSSQRKFRLRNPLDAVLASTASPPPGVIRNDAQFIDVSIFLLVVEL